MIDSSLTTTEPKVKDYAINIQSAGKTLKDIINSILGITKIESGKLTIYSAPYNIIELLNHILNMCENLILKKGLSLKYHIDEKLPEILIGDETHIYQVLMNIMSNAIKYTHHGTITLTVSLASLSPDGTSCKVYFSIKDTGIGIKEADRERLFEKFERLGQEFNYNVEETGLGMSIVTQLLSAMNSKIELESIYGVGSDFYFTLSQNVMDKSPIGEINIPYIDLSIAKKYNANLKMYLNNLSTYTNSFNVTSQKLRLYKEEKDIKNFCIVVHGLKSTSKLIGSITLSNQAAQLEEACHLSNSSYVWDHTDALLSLYEECYLQIKDYLSLSLVPTSSKAISMEEYNKLLNEIKEAADHFDMGQFIVFEQELTSLIVPNEELEYFEKLKPLFQILPSPNYLIF